MTSPSFLVAVAAVLPLASAYTATASRYAAGVAASSSAAAARRSALADTTMLTEVDKASWCRSIENVDKLAVVFFYAPWCRNCKAVRPRLERLEREFMDVSFFQANFKKEGALCYEERVFTFPTVHLYLPGVGRVSRSVLTAKNTDEKMRAALARFYGDQAQVELLQQITAEALSPVVHYQELVSALQALQGLEAKADDFEGLAPGLSPVKESARLRTMVESDEQRLAMLEELFRSLDVDADGRLALGELEAAVRALQPEGGESVTTNALMEALKDGGPDTVGVDKETFITLMVDKAVADFAAGEKALLPAFEALDADGDGKISQGELLETIENFCNSMPETDGCDIDQRPLRLAEAFEAFADDERQIDYQRFVEMVSGRRDGDECEIGEEEDEAAAEEARRAAYMAEELEMMGERECFGDATTEDGEDDLGCDAWFYGQDPLEGREQDPAKVEALARAAEAVSALRAKRRQEEEAQRLKKAQLEGAAPVRVITG